MPALIKRVTFSARPPLIQPVPNLSNTSDEDIRATWYSPGEYNGMKDEIRETLGDARRGENGDLRSYERAHPDVFCLSGIEHLTSRRALRTREADKDAAISAVLEEQSRQRMMMATGAGTSLILLCGDPSEAIRAKYVSATRRARNLALKNASNHRASMTNAGNPGEVRARLEELDSTHAARRHALQQALSGIAVPVASRGRTMTSATDGTPRTEHDCDEVPTPSMLQGQQQQGIRFFAVEDHQREDRPASNESAAAGTVRIHQARMGNDVAFSMEPAAATQGESHPRKTH